MSKQITITSAYTTSILPNDTQASSRRSTITSGSSSYSSSSGIPNLSLLKIDDLGNLFVPGNVISYADFDTDVGSLFDNLPIASSTSKGIAQFSGSQFNVVDGVVSIKDGEVGLDESELNTYLTNNNYATHSWVTNQNYLKTHQSLAGYATETWVNNQNFLTSHQSLTGYATESWVSTNFNKYVHPATHGASIIRQDSTHRFVTDTEKSTWNSKWDWNASTVAGVKVNNSVLADKALKLNTARTISLSGDLSGSTSFDGSANKTITTTINSLDGVSVEKIDGEDTLVFTGNLIATGNIVGYGDAGTNVGTIFDNLPDASTSSKGVAQFSTSQFTVTNGIVSIKDDEIGLNETELATYLANNSYSTKTWVNNNSIKRTGDTVTGNYTFNGNLNISGNITQNGSSYITDAEHINVGSNLAVMNQNETGAGVSTVLSGTSIPFSGWEIERGSEENFYFGFDEQRDRFVVGKKSELKTVAAMSDSLVHNKLLVYNTTTHQLENRTEYSAFNKNFGTSAGTVSEGNHTHNYQPKVSTRWVYVYDSADDCYLQGGDDNPTLFGHQFGAQITDYGDKVVQNTLWKVGGIDAKYGLSVNGTSVSLSGHTHTPSQVGLSNLSKSGDELKIQTADGNVVIGPSNGSWCHYSTDRVAHWFNKKVAVDGDIYSYSTPGNKITSSGVYRDGVLVSKEGHTHAKVMSNSHATAFGSPEHALYYHNRSDDAAFGVLPSGTNWGHYLSMEHGGYSTGNGYKAILATPFWDERWYVKTIEPGNNKAWRQIFTDAHPPTSSQVGALSTSGGTLTGSLVSKQITISDSILRITGTSKYIHFDNSSSSSYDCTIGNYYDYDGYFRITNGDGNVLFNLYNDSNGRAYLGGYGGNGSRIYADNYRPYADNAGKLDNIDSGSFLRSDATDYINNTLYNRGYIVNETGYRNRGVYGNYDSNKTNHIWSMGTAYKNAADGSNFGNLYGLAYKHTNNATGGSMAGGHQMVWCQNGTGTSAMGSGLWTSGSTTSGGKIYANGSIRLGTDKNISFDGADTYYMREATGSYGTVAVYGRKSSWSGYSIEGRSVFMHDGGNATGIYNDVDNEWQFLAYRNGDSMMYHNGGEKIRANSSGAQITGSLTATSNITAYSDARLKDNIITLKDALSKVNRLRGVTYTRKDQEDKSKVHIGLIAQEVEKVFPELVETHDDEDKTKSVNYQNMVAVLLEAVKDLTDKVEYLENKIRK